MRSPSASVVASCSALGTTSTLRSTATGPSIPRCRTSPATVRPSGTLASSPLTQSCMLRRPYYELPLMPATQRWRQAAGMTPRSLAFHGRDQQFFPDWGEGSYIERHDWLADP